MTTMFVQSIKTAEGEVVVCGLGHDACSELGLPAGTVSVSFRGGRVAVFVSPSSRPDVTASLGALPGLGAEGAEAVTRALAELFEPDISVHPFNQSDWYAYCGAERFPGGGTPLVAVVESPCEIALPADAPEASGTALIGIADATGVQIELVRDQEGYHESPLWNKRIRLTPETADRELRAALSAMLAGRIPAGYERVL